MSNALLMTLTFAEKWGDLGPVYGAQWVNWPRYEDAGQGLYRRAEKGINQIELLVESLKNNPGSRRHIFEGWNVAELDRMALPPCHKTYQFHVAEWRVERVVVPAQSAIWGWALALMSFRPSMLIRMLAQQCGYEPGEN